MPQNSPPEYVLQFQAKQRERLDGLLSFFHEQAARFEMELPGLDPQSEEFQAKRLWCDGWGAMGRGIEGILRTADGLAETNPTAAGYLLNHAVTIANGMMTADNYTQSAHAQHLRVLIPIAQSEARADQGRAASRAKAEQRQNGPIKRRHELVTTLVSALSEHERRQSPGRIAMLVLDQVNAALQPEHEPVSGSTVRNDIIQLNLS